MIPENILSFFTTSHIPVRLSLPHIVGNSDYEIGHDLEVFIQRLDEDEVNEVSLESGIYLLPIEEEKINHKARLELATQLVESKIDLMRFQILSNNFESKKPPPYSHDDLSDVDYDSNWLVNLRDFSGDGCELFHRNSVFHILPSLPGLNSMYWAIRNLKKIIDHASVKIRLDPLIVQPLDKFKGSMSYAMYVYGVPLDWNDIENLKEERHCQWTPDNVANDQSKMTDLVWSPRNDGIHFICEEVPKIDTSQLRGSRYFHSIYNPEKKVFYHTDGAIRVYSEEEIQIRHKMHVRNSGKIGKRIKVFKADGEISRDEWCNLAASFYVWNDDVVGYFNGEKTII